MARKRRMLVVFMNGVLGNVAIFRSIKLGRSKEAKAIRKVACNILKMMLYSVVKKTGILN